MYSIMERVKTLGWADELSKMGPHDHGLGDESYIEKTCQKDISNRGNILQSTQRHRLTSLDSPPSS